MALVIELIRALLSLYILALFARTFLEMVLGPYHGVVVFLQRITEPLLAPIRRYIPPIRRGATAWDLSTMIAIILLLVVDWILRLIRLSIVF